jgi:hypothetical protein
VRRRRADGRRRRHLRWDTADRDAWCCPSGYGRYRTEQSQGTGRTTSTWLAIVALGNRDARALAWGTRGQDAHLGQCLHRAPTGSRCSQHR